MSGDTLTISRIAGMHAMALPAYLRLWRSDQVSEDIMENYIFMYP